MEHEVRTLEAVMRAEFSGMREIAARMHAETAGRLERIELRSERIEEQVRETNGRVTRHDEQIKTLFERVREGVTKGALTLADLKWYLVVAGSCIAGTYGFLRLFGMPQ